MADILELHEFFSEGSSQERSHVLLHLTEPGTPEERAKGYFFALCEINNGQIGQIEHLQQMIDDLESGYYETDDLPNKNAFELTLEYINRRGHHILENKEAVAHCLVGVLRGHDIFFSYHGNPHAFLFYKSKDQIESMNVIGNAQDEQQNQLFSSVLQGQLNSGDYFYASSPHVIDYFTPDRIIKILQTRNTRQSAEHIQRVLGDLNSDLSFGGIFLHFPTTTDVPKTGKTPLRLDNTGSEASLDKLADQEKITEQIMSPPLLGGLKGKLATIRKERETERLKQLEKAQEERQKKLTSEKGRIETNIRPRAGKKESILNTILIGVGKTIVWVFTKIIKFIKLFVFGIGRGFLVLFVLATNYGNQRQEVFCRHRLWWYEKKEQFAAIPLFSKILLFLTLFLAIVFIASITIYKTRAAIQAERQAYENSISAIQDKKNAADGSLVYNDTNRALTLLQEAKNILEKLPTNNEERESKQKELSQSLEESFFKIRKLTVVTPEVIVDLTKTKQDVKATGLSHVDGFIFAHGTDDSNLYKIALDGFTVETKDHPGFSKIIAGAAPKENDMLVFLADDNKIAAYSMDSGAVIPKDIAFSRNNVKLSAMFLYNRKLYVIDTTNNKIGKHNPTQGGYDKGVDWLKEELDVKDAISLAVDGDMFVLKSNGEIYKLNAGAKQEFSISGLDPALDKPTVLRTNSAMNNIYILEPTNKRVVVLEKTGKLIAQYTANEWQNPTGMIIDEAKKTAYVLDNNKIYKFELK